MTNFSTFSRNGSFDFYPDKFEIHIFPHCTDDAELPFYIIKRKCWVSVMCLSLSILGIIGNVTTVSIIAVMKRFHQPTFICILCLACSDLMTIVTNYIFRFFLLTNSLSIRNTIINQHDPDYHQIYVTVYSLGVWLGWYLGFTWSSANTVLLSVTRFLLIVHPLKAMTFMTNKRIAVISSLGFVTSLLICLVPICLKVFLTGEENWKVVSASEFVFRITVFLFPVVTIIVLHVMKMRAISKSVRLRTQAGITRAMNIVIIIILLLYVLCHTSYVISDTIQLAMSLGISVSLESAWDKLFAITDILFVINYAVNPFIYFGTVLIKMFHRKLHSMDRTGMSSSRTTVATAASS